MPYAIINEIRTHYEVTGRGAPVLLISGLGAPSGGWALQVEALARRIRRARLTVLPGSHGVFIEHADLFNRAVLRFLKSVRST